MKDRAKAIENQVQKHKHDIAKGLAATWAVSKVIEAWRDTAPNRLWTRQEAADWVRIHVPFDSALLGNALRDLWATGAVIGSDAADHALAVAGAADESVRITTSFDWSRWSPGNREAALIANPKGGFAERLASRNVVLKGIDKTTADRIGTVLSRGLEDGLTPSVVSTDVAGELIDSRTEWATTLEDRLQQVQDDFSRAETIARTEMNQAVADEVMNRYDELGVTQVQWNVINPCDACAENDGEIRDLGDEFPTGDIQPVVHPNCNCFLTPVIDDGSASADSVDMVDSADLEMSAKALIGWVLKFNENHDERGRFASTDGSSGTPSDADKKIWDKALLKLDAHNATQGYNSTHSKEKDLLAARSDMKSMVAEKTVEALKNVPAQELAAVANYNVVSSMGTSVLNDAAQAMTSQTGNVGLDNITLVALNEQGQLDIQTADNVVDPGRMDYSQMTVSDVQDALGKSDMNFVVAGSPEAESMVREASTTVLVNQWAQSSNDSDPLSLAMQQVAADKFGITGHAGWDLANSGYTKEAQDEVTAKLNDIVTNHGDTLNAFLQAQYQGTQEYLKANNVTSVTLYRGLSGLPDSIAQTISGSSTINQDITTRPLTSWSTDPKVAETFGGVDRVHSFDDGKNDAMVRAVIPADRIFSTPMTGFGCLNEKEFVVLGGADKADIVTSGKYVDNQLAHKDPWSGN